MMKKNHGPMALLALLLAGLFSCQKDPTIFYGDRNIGNIVREGIQTDDQLRYLVTEDRTDGKWKEEKRIFFHCDILEKLDGKTYGIRLHQYQKVLYKPALRASTADLEEAGHDTTMVSDLWRGGSTVNILACFPVRTGNRNRHVVNLVFEDQESRPDSLVFSLRRNAHGGGLSLDEMQEPDVVLNYFFFSSDLTDFLPDQDTPCRIVINNGSNR